MDKLLFDRIIQQLLPEMGDLAARKALIESALYGSPLLAQIQWDGAARPFIVRLVRQLHEYGEIEAGSPALVTLLDEVKGQVGANRQKQIDDLIANLTQQKGQAKMALESMVVIGFLIEVGRWAKKELSETWKVRRAQEETVLTDKTQVESTIPDQLKSIIAEKSEREVARIVALIERKRDAIDRAQNAKLADREEHDAQKLIKSAFEQRAKEHNRTIQQMLDEIADDLNDLGFEVERNPV